MKFKSLLFLLPALLTLSACTPTQPDNPTDPDTPVEPGDPEDPDTPVTPDPEDPEEPDTPVTPDPEDPDEPDEPDTPVTPDDPVDPNTPTNSSDVNVIVLAGQSNAEGNSYFKKLEQYCIDKGESYEQYVRGYEDIKIAYHNHYYAGVSYLYSNRDNPYEANFVNVKVGQGKTLGWSGPELGMAKYIHDSIDSDKPIYIIKYASGGTSFAGNPSWKPSKNQLYSYMTKFVDNGLLELTNKGYTPKIRAFCWMQGESDSGNSTNANAYKDSLKTMITSFRSKYQSYAENNDGNNIGVVDAFISDSGAWSQYQTINAAKATLSSELANYYTIDTTKTGLNLGIKDTGYGGGDNYHYAMDGMLTLGKAFGQTILDKKLLKYNTGAYSDNLNDFSITGTTPSKSFTYEAEHAEIDSRTGIQTEAASGASNGSCVSYFREGNRPRIRFVVHSDKDENNALVTMSLASALEQTVKELPHLIYKQHRLTVNGEAVRLNGTMPIRSNGNWHNFKEHQGYINLKKGYNIIEFHHDYNQAYQIEEERMNIDYLKIQTTSATITKVNSATLEAEKMNLLGGAYVSGNVSNNPSGGYSIEGLSATNSSASIDINVKEKSLVGVNLNIGLTDKIADLSQYLKVTFNNTEMSLDEVRLPECSLDYTKGSDYRNFYLGQLSLEAGDYTFKITAKKAGFTALIDYVKFYSLTSITMDTPEGTNDYKFEAEDTSHFTSYGNVKVAQENNCNNPSGGYYLGGYSYNVGGNTFTFNAAADARVTLKFCLGLTLEFNFEECYDLTLSNSAGSNQKIDTTGLIIPQYSANQWFDWRLITICEIDIKAGQNILDIKHPLGSPYYGANLDYIIVTSDVVIS